MIHEKFCKYLKAIGFSDTYEHQIKPFLRFCEAENIDFRNIAYEDFCNFIIHLQEKEYGKGYINNLIKAVRKFYTFLSDSEDLDPKYLETVRKFKLLKTDTKLHDYITLKELDELIGEALTYIRRIRPIKMKALLYFLFFTGVRRDELINMKRDNIDLEESKAIIKTPTKNKEERYAYYPDKVSQLLSTYFRVENENTNAFNMNRNKLQYLISRLNKLMPKGRSLTIHTFRHSFAMMLADSNVNVKVSQKLMGHKNINSTMVYYNPNAKMIERIYRKNVKG